MKRTRPEDMGLVAVRAEGKFLTAVLSNKTVADLAKEQSRAGSVLFFQTYTLCQAADRRETCRFLRDPGARRFYAIREVDPTALGEVPVADVRCPTDGAVHIGWRAMAYPPLTSYVQMPFRTSAKSDFPDVVLRDRTVREAVQRIGDQLSVPHRELHLVANGTVLHHTSDLFPPATRKSDQPTLFAVRVNNRVTLLPRNRPHYCTTLPTVVPGGDLPAVRVTVELGGDTHTTLALWCHPDATVGDIEARVNMELEPDYFGSVPRAELEEMQRELGDQLSYAARQRLCKTIQSI